MKKKFALITLIAVFALLALFAAGDTLTLLVACDTLPLSRRSLPAILRMDSLKAFVASKLATPFPPP